MSEQPEPARAQDHPVTEQTEGGSVTRRAAQVAAPPPHWMIPRAADDAASPPAQQLVPDAAAGAPTAPVDPADADLFEDGWNAPRRTSKATALLAAGIVAAAGFAAGAYLQRSHDQGLIPTASAGAGAGARAGFGGGAGFGGAAGFGGGTAGAGGTGRASGAAGAGQAGAGAAAQAPAVVGTVSAVHGSTVTVKNFGGAAIEVHVSDTTSVTSVGLGGLKPGATVAVFGTKAGDGSVTATSIVSRKAG